jgi:microcystin-dependent protein
VLGNVGGAESQTLTTAQIPSHLHPLASQHFGGNLSIGTEDADHLHIQQGTFTSAGANSSLDHTHVQHNHTAIGGVTGGGGAVNDSGNDGAAQTGTSSLGGMDHSHNVTIGGATSGRNAAHAHTINGNTQLAGGGTAHPNTQPAMVLTIYIKL